MSRITGMQVKIGDTVYKEMVKSNGEKYLIPVENPIELPFDNCKDFFVPLRLLW